MRRRIRTSCIRLASLARLDRPLLGFTRNPRPTRLGSLANTFSLRKANDPASNQRRSRLGCRKPARLIHWTQSARPWLFAVGGPPPLASPARPRIRRERPRWPTVDQGSGGASQAELKLLFPPLSAVIWHDILAVRGRPPHRARSVDDDPKPLKPLPDRAGLRLYGPGPFYTYVRRTSRIHAFGMAPVGRAAHRKEPDHGRLLEARAPYDALAEIFRRSSPLATPRIACLLTPRHDTAAKPVYTAGQAVFPQLTGL
jgi:hypothetical protein